MNFVTNLMYLEKGKRKNASWDSGLGRGESLTAAGALGKGLGGQPEVLPLVMHITHCKHPEYQLLGQSLWSRLGEPTA